MSAVEWADPPPARRGAYVVERILDEEHTVLVSLDPAIVAGDIAHALRWVPTPITGEDVRASLILRPVLSVTLTPAEAAQLAEDLMAAAVDPVPCARGCGRLADSDYCGACLDGGAGEVRR